MRKILSICLVLSLCLCMGISAFAAEIDTSGGSGTTPVSLTTTNNGLGGGDGGDGGEGGGGVTPTKLNVVVPTSLPMAMADDGTVVTATDCKVINNSYGAVRIKSVTISAAENWHLTAFGTKASLAGEKVDSNKLGEFYELDSIKQRIQNNVRRKVPFPEVKEDKKAPYYHYKERSER